VIETYTIDYAGPAPKAVVVGRLEDGGARFIAMTAPDDTEIVQTMIDREPLGARVTLAPDDAGHTVIKTITPSG
jgi:hypothetical protein